MKSLGIDLAAMAGPAPSLDLVPRCPGGNLRVTRSDLSTLVSGGERFEPSGETIPYNGYGMARVMCGNPVEQISASKSPMRQFFGLCRSCSQLEADNRTTLHARGGSKP